MSKGAMDLVAEAHEVVETIDVEEAKRLHAEGGVVFVDLREAGERVRAGVVPGALAVPRGLLEFYIDPAMPHHHEAFASPGRKVFFCASGGRSALAAKTAIEMGVEGVCHVAGGFGAWAEAGGPIEPGGEAAG